MFAKSRGIVFSTEAVVASAIFLATLLFLVYSSVHVSAPDFAIQQSMTVAHDLAVNNSSSPPEGFVNNEDWCKANMHYVAKLKVSDYYNWHAEVCMK